MILFKVPIKDIINHYHRTLFCHIPGSGHSFTTYPGVAQFYDIPRLAVLVE